MARHYTGKQSLGIKKVKRPNGDIYVYERTTVYDRERQKTVTLSSKLLGKIPVGTEQMVNTRSKKTHTEEPDSALQPADSSQILNWVAEASHIDEHLHQAFPLGDDADKMASLARYLLATGRQSLTGLESWQVMHPTPYDSPLSEAICSKLFKSVGENAEEMQRYFLARCSLLSNEEILAFDVTSPSNQKEAWREGSLDEEYRANLLCLYSLHSQEPIAFAYQPRNLSNVLSIKTSLEQMGFFDPESPLIVTEAGYDNEANLARFCQEGMRFLSLASKDSSWSTTQLDTHRKELKKMENAYPFNPSIHGYTATVQPRLESAAPQNSKKEAQKLYLHIFYDREMALCKEREFSARLLQLKELLKEGVTEFNAQAKREIDKFITISGKEHGRQYSFNEDNIAEESKYWGFFVLVSNVQRETFEALKIYRLREEIEESFSYSYKGNETQTAPLQGWQFTQWIALSYRCFLTKKIASIKEELTEFSYNYKQAQQGKEKYSSSEYAISLEDKQVREDLLHWLKEKSVQEILDWFDSVEKRSAKTASGRRGRIPKRDRLFLRLLMGGASLEGGL